VRRRGWTRQPGLALALLLPLSALAVAGGPAGVFRHSGVMAAGDLTARVPSVGAFRTPRVRDTTAPGATRASYSWAVVLLASALALALSFAAGRARIGAHLRTRAPPDLRLA
jgi:hypothetical protein